MTRELSSSEDLSLLAELDEMVRLALTIQAPSNDVPCERCAAGMPCFWHDPFHLQAPR